MNTETRTYDPIRLEVFKHLFASIPEEMGVILRKSAFSPNIKERRDYSCALFDSHGNMIAQATHIPVHLGAMPLSVKSTFEVMTFEPGDIAILNDPFHGGTHLPDITMITPIFVDQGLFGFAANRAHHTDIGGMSPGSMPIAREIYQEGLILPPVKLVQKGVLNTAILDILLANVRTPIERAGDLEAQMAANRRGMLRQQNLIERYGYEEINFYSKELLSYTERMTRNLLSHVPDGEYTFEDQMDDDGITNEPFSIKVKITIQEDHAVVDFSGSSPQRRGSVNAVYAITLSAVYYAFRCLIGLDVPNNSGCMIPIQVIAPEGSVVNANHPAPVAGGNVETSQRIVDVLLGALAKAVPDEVPAASQGTMNNILIGGVDPKTQKPFSYYETIAGGMGARPDRDGISAIHTHMTNTLNTPIEALEISYPFQVQCYSIRDGSGGDGHYHGGDGIRRDLHLLCDAHLSLMSDRRHTRPYGINGGNPGVEGKNILIRDGEEQILPGKGEFELKSGDTISIRTPGGGGYGSKED